MIPFVLISEKLRDELEQYKVCQILNGELIIHGEICYTHLLIGHPYKNMKYEYLLAKYNQHDIDDDGYKYMKIENFLTKTQPITHKQATQEIGIPIPTEYTPYKIHIISYDNYNNNPKNQYDSEIQQSTRKEKNHIIICTDLDYTGRGMVICNAEHFNYIYLIVEEKI